MALYPYELKLPLAPYQFVWKDEPAVDAEKRRTQLFTEERYKHGDGSVVVVREYHADGSFHIMSDRGEIELVDNANDPWAANPVSLVRLPLYVEEGLPFGHSMTTKEVVSTRVGG